LLLRRPLVTAAQAVVGVVIFGVVVLWVRDALTGAGPVHTLNIAVITLSLGMLMAANVTLLGERTGTLPWQLQRWAARLPLGATQVARVIVVFSILRSGLLTLALLAAVAIGALTVAHSSTSVVVILGSAVLLPLLPVALGLQWARRRGASVSIAFTIVPLGIGFTAASVPLPLTSGWVETSFGWIALPGMLLVGRASFSVAVVFLAAWTALALTLMRPAALSLRDSSVGRGFGSSISRLSRIPASPSPNRLALDIAVHMVGLTDLLEILFLGAVSCSVVALQSLAKDSLFGELAMGAGLSAAAATATIAGYVHMRATVGMDPPTEAWIRTLPLSARALSVARHAVCSAGSVLAVVPVMVLAIVKSGWPPSKGPSPWRCGWGWPQLRLPAGSRRTYRCRAGADSWAATLFSAGAAFARSQARPSWPLGTNRSWWLGCSWWIWASLRSASGEALWQHRESGAGDASELGGTHPCARR
jgi:hypothetical protein